MPTVETRPASKATGSVAANLAASGADSEQLRVILDIGGMSCASCAARIEQRLNTLDGVAASVNYATEQAHVRVPPGYDTEALVAEVEKTGYTAAQRTQRAAAAAAAQTDGAEGAQTDATSAAPTDAAGAQPVVAAGARGTLTVAERALRQRLIVSSYLAVPVIAMAMIPALQFRGWQWVSLLLATPVVLWGGWPFHRAAWLNLKHRAVTMDTLVSLGTGAALLWSCYALFFGHAGMLGLTHEFVFTLQHSDGAANIYLEAAAGVTMLLLAGRFFEQRAKRRAGAALRALLELGAKEVSRWHDGTETRVPVDQLRVGDRFVVRPGEKIATDGVIIEGHSTIDTAMLTGESVPVDAGVGDRVTGGTLSVTGRIMVRATGIGADTQLAQMARLVEAAQSGKANMQRIADRISRVFVPVVIVIALVTFASWLVLGNGLADAFTAAVAVLIIACPCALGLATPMALLVGTGRGAQLGVLIRGPEVLESTRRIDTVVFDKTGTVTSGRMTLTEVVVAAGEHRAQVLRLLGAVEAASEHPIAQAIANGVAAELGEDVAELPSVERFENVAGSGVVGAVEGHEVRVGRFALGGIDAAAAAPLRAEFVRLERAGNTAVLISWDGVARGVAAVADTVKPSSGEAVRELARLGLDTVMLTGDNRAVAEQVARQLGIGQVQAGLLPGEKVAAIRAMQAEGRVVAMVGDGVNDAPALAQADLGIAMGGGTDAAIAAADVTLMSDSLRSVTDAIRLSRRTLGTINGNLFWAFAYNVAAIPLAAFGLLNPMIAGAAMALSSVFVVGNSLLLRRFRGRQQAAKPLERVH